MNTEAIKAIKLDYVRTFDKLSVPMTPNDIKTLTTVVRALFEDVTNVWVELKPITDNTPYAFSIISNLRDFTHNSCIELLQPLFNVKLVNSGCPMGCGLEGLQLFFEFEPVRASVHGRGDEN